MEWVKGRLIGVAGVAGAVISSEAAVAAAVDTVHLCAGSEVQAGGRTPGEAQVVSSMPGHTVARRHNLGRLWTSSVAAEAEPEAQRIAHLEARSAAVEDLDVVLTRAAGAALIDVVAGFDGLLLDNS